MVTIGMNYRVRPGREEVFEAACGKVIELMAEMEGHDSSRIFREIGKEDGSYLIVSRWVSEDAFTAFTRSDAFKKVTDWGAANILEERPLHTTYYEEH